MGDMPSDRADLLVEGAPSESFSTVLSNGRSKNEYYAPIPADRFAPKTGDRILQIGIIGAGIAGLSAAIALTQSGHNVEVSEIQTNLVCFARDELTPTDL